MTIFGINFTDLWENISGFTTLFVVAFAIVIFMWLIYKTIKKVSHRASQTKQPSHPVAKKLDKRSTPSHNPFIHGNPVAPEQLIGRDGELRRIAGRIITGQSTIITGSPRSGKTSVLQGLMLAPNEERAKTLYGDTVNKLIFSYLDVFKATQFNKAQFWESVLEPLQKRIVANTPLFKAYQMCQNRQFETNEVENLISEINQANWRLVLLIDEFDKFLDNTILTENQGEFFANLRALVVSPDNQGALVLVITSSLSRSQLNNETLKSSNGSPYFNIMDEFVLGALSESEVDELLAQGNFTDDDCGFIKDIAGGHPYLLQVVASTLWESYEDGNEDNFAKQQRVKDYFYLKVKETLKNIWDSWDQEKQSIFMSVALVHLEKLGIKFPKEVDIKSISNSLSLKASSLIELERYGFLRRDDKMHGGWRVYPGIFLLFIIDIFKPEYRDKLSNKAWEKLSTPKSYKRFF
ncbi:ATP-binding protein [Candidatus Parabeggiatoa sp. HSG14]|uniref:ATP-binding protein n=1 Tax=Candidatus Parabeggiatoa sp. HSG14 TaxID=3055593 RepID=UPI0025A8BAEF|nr:ATP-binding protein [Thiotrichales bacterium HSG14]